jgi:hypothetical protein
MILPAVLLFAAVLETGKPMPVLNGEFLSGRKASLPAAAGGRVAMYTLGFSYDSRFAVEAWVARFKKDFAAQHKITFYEVPVLGGMDYLGKPFIDRGMRNGTPKEFHENVLNVWGGKNELKKTVQLKNEKHAVVILADGQGTVHWQWQGMMDEAKYLEMKAVADKLLAREAAK